MEDAKSELEALSAYMPDISDADTTKLALRMYYVELTRGISPSDAQTNVGQMFLISPITVQRWATSWEETGEEALQDYRGLNQELDPSLLFFLSTLSI